jgi:hypothetical protein
MEGQHRKHEDDPTSRRPGTQENPAVHVRIELANRGQVKQQIAGS